MYENPNKLTITMSFASKGIFLTSFWAKITFINDFITKSVRYIQIRLCAVGIIRALLGCICKSDKCNKYNPNFSIIYEHGFVKSHGAYFE